MKKTSSKGKIPYDLKPDAACCIAAALEHPMPRIFGINLFVIFCQDLRASSFHRNSDGTPVWGLQHVAAVFWTTGRLVVILSAQVDCSQRYVEWTALLLSTVIWFGLFLGRSTILQNCFKYVTKCYFILQPLSWQKVWLCADHFRSSPEPVVYEQR